MKNTLENSKLITDFIGADLLKDLLSDNNGFININIDIYEQCKFHSDWNWLISVVEKIESLGHCVLIFKDSVYIKENTIISSKTISKCENRPKIEAVYNACLEFIKWYNKQDKNNENLSIEYFSVREKGQDTVILTEEDL